MSRLALFSNVVLHSGVWWGIVLTVGFYSPWNSALWNHRWAVRLLAAHPASIVETGLFFVAMATLAIRGWRVLCEHLGLPKPLLVPAVPGGQPADTCGQLLGQLATLPPRRQDDHIARRLRDALQLVTRQGGAEALDQELKFLSARDRRRTSTGYGFVVLIAVVILLAGIAATLARGANTTGRAEIARSAQRPALVAANVSGATDSTVLALVLVGCLAAALWAVWTGELRLLERVDDQASRELMGRFQQFGSANDPHLLAIRRMADAVVQVTERLVQRQTELWKSTVTAAHDEWSRLAAVSAEQTRSALEATLAPSLREFAARLAAATETTHARNPECWRRTQEPFLASQETAARPDVSPPDRAENRAA